MVGATSPITWFLITTAYLNWIRITRLLLLWWPFWTKIRSSSFAQIQLILSPTQTSKTLYVVERVYGPLCHVILILLITSNKLLNYTLFRFRSFTFHLQSEIYSNPPSNINNLTPNFSVVKSRPSRFVLVMDISHNMSDNVILRINQMTRIYSK